MSAFESKDRKHATEDEKKKREEGLDRTVEQSFPASDPPSSIPDPDDDELAEPSQPDEEQGEE
jgi:hypothetical protein